MDYSALCDPIYNKLYFDPQNVVLSVLVASIVTDILEIMYKMLCLLLMFVLSSFHTFGCTL